MLAAVLVCVSLSAAAEVASGPALALYQQGDYAAAVKAGIAQNDENGFAVAARAELAAENLGDKPCLPCLMRAEGYARRAIAAGGKLPESHVYLAAALGHEARVKGLLHAGLANYAEQSKDAIDAALRIQPNFSWALAALGGWHIEVVRSGGSWLGELFYDASFDKGLAYFERAVAGEPRNPVIHFQFALALASYDLDEQRGRVMKELTQAANGAAVSAYDTAIKQRATRLLALLVKNDDAAVLALVRKYQGYP
jgi:tetratricopeptide (TPR) repeat protein